jgi:hypothetical protein
MLRFIEDFHLARTRDLWQLAFSDTTIRRCQQRLTALVKQKKIKRFRGYASQDYLYYIDKRPDQIEHDLLRIDVFMRLRNYDLQDFRPEFTYGHLRSDGYFELGDVAWFLEIQLSTGNVQEKYEALHRRLDWRQEWEVFPSVLIVTNKKIKIETTDINFKIIGCDLIGLDGYIGRSNVGSCRVQVT